MKNISRNIILIVIGVIIIMGGIIYFQHSKISKLKNDNQVEVKLKDALLDSVKYYQNIRNEWVAEKLTIQQSIGNLEKINNQLNSLQKELINRIVEANKKSDVIAAALIKSTVKIDSLLHKGQTIVDTTNRKITFSDSYKNDSNEVEYNFTVGNVLPINSLTQPTLSINSLYFPNSQFIDFQWKNEKKKGYPITFSVSNSNGFFKTVDIESYAIPNLTKEFVNPNGWQKFENFFIRNGKTLFHVGLGAVGVGGIYYLVK